MSAATPQIPHESGAMSESDAIERMLARDSAGQIPEPRSEDDLLDERDPDEAVEASEAEAPELDLDESTEDESLEDDEETEAVSDPVVRFDDGTELALSEVKRGYLRQQDYTRKTQEAAELRKTLEGERSAFNAEKRQVADRLTPLIQQVQASLNNPSVQAELNELRQVDPGAYAVRMMEIQQQQARAQQLAWEQQQLRETVEREEMEKFTRERAETAKASRATLMETIPAFKKDFDAEYRALGAWVLEQGIPAEVWDNEVDHRVITLAWKAKQYDLATRKTPATTKQLRNAPKPMRPGAAKPAGYAQARAVREATERAHQSGSVDDAIAAQLARMGAR